MSTSYDYESCHNYSSSIWLPIIYLITYIVALLLLSFLSYIYLHREHVYDGSNFLNSNHASDWSFINWGKDLWYRRRCYIPFLTHLFDQATDLAVCIEFYDLWDAQSKDETICIVVSGEQLFVISIGILLLYRIISCKLIYDETKRIRQCILQFLDLELLHTLYINNKLNKTEPCDPQRWIQSLEAIFEAVPQAVLQAYFVIQTRTFSMTIFLSLIFSCFTIASKIIMDDKSIFKTRYQEANILKNGNLINSKYLIRIVWRLCDITSRMFGMISQFLVMGLYIFCTLRIVDIMFLGIMSCIAKEPYLMQNLIAMSYITSTEQAHLIGKISAMTILLKGFFSNIGIIIFASVDFECDFITIPSYLYPNEFCPFYEIRREYLFGEWDFKNNKIIIFSRIMFWVSFAMSLIVPMFLLHFVGRGCKDPFTHWKLTDEKEKSWFKPTVTKTRNFPSLVRTGNFEGLMEYIEFGFKIPKNVTKEQMLNKCINVIINSHNDVSIDKLILYFRYFYQTYHTPVDLINELTLIDDLIHKEDWKVIEKLYEHGTFIYNEEAFWRYYLYGLTIKNIEIRDKCINFLEKSFIDSKDNQSSMSLFVCKFDIVFAKNKTVLNLSVQERKEYFGKLLKNKENISWLNSEFDIITKGSHTALQSLKKMKKPKKNRKRKLDTQTLALPSHSASLAGSGSNRDHESNKNNNNNNNNNNNDIKLELINGNNEYLTSMNSSSNSNGTGNGNGKECMTPPPNELHLSFQHGSASQSEHETSHVTSITMDSDGNMKGMDIIDESNERKLDQLIHYFDIKIIINLLVRKYCEVGSIPAELESIHDALIHLGAIDSTNDLHSQANHQNVGD